MMRQAGVVEQSDVRDFKAGVFGNWKENGQHGNEGPVGLSYPSRPPGARAWVGENERDREAGSSHKSQLSAEQKSKKHIQRSRGPMNFADERS